MPRLPTRDLEREIAREIADDPDISIRGIGRRLRERGIRAGNDRLRAIARGARAGITSGNLAGFDAGIFRTPRQARTAIRELAGDIGRDALPDPTHAAVTYTATVRYRLTFYGDEIETGTETLRGTVVQPIEAYRPDLIAERVANSLAQRITQRVGSGTTTYIEGLEVQILASDVRVDNVELRGSARRAVARRGR